MDIKKAERRREQAREWKRNRFKKLRAEHRCIWCKKKVKPVITYPQFCADHNEKNRKLKKTKK